MKSRRFLLLVPLALLLGGCASLPRIGLFMDQPETALPFRARLDSAGDGSRDFTVTVNARGAALAEFRESARFPAVRHCLRSFGSSEMEWARNGGSDWAVRYTDGGRPVVAGRCTGR